MTEVILGKEDNECAKLGSDAIEAGGAIVRVVWFEAVVDMEDVEVDLLKDMGI